jgi:hypothetical protein
MVEIARVRQLEQFDGVLPARRQASPVRSVTQPANVRRAWDLVTRGFAPGIPDYLPAIARGGRQMMITPALPARRLSYL